jgi:hypothetical protein
MLRALVAAMLERFGHETVTDASERVAMNGGQRFITVA